MGFNPTKQNQYWRHYCVQPDVESKLRLRQTWLCAILVLLLMLSLFIIVPVGNTVPLRWAACFFHKLSDYCSGAGRVLPGKLQKKALVMMFVEIKKSCCFEFLVMWAWLEVELWLLYIVWMVTMGSSSRASLNGVSSAITKAFPSYDLWLFAEGKEWDFLFYFGGSF